MSTANINHTPKRWKFNADPGPCAGCQYTEHCAGNKDAVTGACRVSPDECQAYRAYGDLKSHEGKSRIPLRVRHSQIIGSHIQRQELIAAC